MIEYLQQVIELVIAILVLLSMIGGLWYRLTKSEKAKKLVEAVNFYQQEIEKYVVLAEKMKNYSGEQKKRWVIDQVVFLSTKNKIPIDEELISNLIEKLIKVTKEVN